MYLVKCPENNDQHRNPYCKNEVDGEKEGVEVQNKACSSTEYGRKTGNGIAMVFPCEVQSLSIYMYVYNILIALTHTNDQQEQVNRFLLIFPPSCRERKHDCIENGCHMK